MLTLNFQFPYPLVNSDRTDGRIRLYHSDGSLVAHLTETITESLVADMTVYLAVVDGVPSAFTGTALFDFEDDAGIATTTVTAEAMAVLVSLALAARSSAVIALNIEIAYDDDHEDREDYRFRLYQADGTLVTGLSLTITLSSARGMVVYTVRIANLPGQYVPGYGLFDFIADDTIRATLVDSVALTTLLDLGPSSYATYDPSLPTAIDRLRFRLGDTNPASPILVNQTYAAVLATHENDEGLAYTELLNAIILIESRLPTRQRVDDVDLTYGNRTKAIETLRGIQKGVGGGFRIVPATRGTRTTDEYSA